MSTSSGTVALSEVAQTERAALASQQLQFCPQLEEMEICSDGVIP